MIDIYNQVFTNVATALRASFSGIKVTGEYVQIPASCPAVTIDEIDNIVVEYDGSGRERFADIRYRVQVFSNLETGKRSQAREIQKIVDDEMLKMNFRRTSYNPLPDVYNATIYSITSIYSARVDEYEVIQTR